MSAYATAVSEMTRDDLITELYRHKNAKDAARDEGRRQGLREAAKIARGVAVQLRTDLDAFSPTAANQCDMLAKAIEAKAGDK